MLFIILLYISHYTFHPGNGQQTDFNISNPYCSQFADTNCQICAQSDSNSYALYDSICTATNDDDKVSGRQIIQRCDPNCGSCDQGLCHSCQIVNEKQLYLDKEIFGGYQSCVTQCRYSFFGDDGSGTCQSCSSNCSICTDGNTCVQCGYAFSRWPDDISSNDQNLMIIPSLDCSNHSARTTLVSTDTGYVHQIYVTPSETDCANSANCDGSLEKPYDNINLVLKHVTVNLKLIEVIKIGKYTKLKVEIYLLKDNTNIHHFWLEDETVPIYYQRMFEGTMIDALMQSAVCNDIVKCFADNETAVVYLKSNRISLFSTWKLNLKKIVFDASELIPDSTCYNETRSTKSRCCDSSGDLPVSSDPNSDAICNPVTSTDPSLTLPDLTYSSSADIWPLGPYSFIVMQTLLNASEPETPQLIIEGCEFKNFWYHRYAHSLIALSDYGSIVNITNTTFTNFYFRNGLIANAYDKLQRETLFTENVMPDFDCSRVNKPGDDCFSLWVEGSTFNYSLFDNIAYAQNGSQQNLNVQNNEGIVLFLVSFNGPITLLDNTFEKLASVKISVANALTCDASSRWPDLQLYHSLDRKVQIELGSEYVGNLRSSSLINIRNLLKGITIYNNTFKNNIALTGTNFLIHNFDNTKEYPIIIEKNIFEANYAFLFGSSFALINYERDYVTMDCDGIYIHDNTFNENTGCPTAVGNVMVVCIPEKPSLSPFLSLNTTFNENSTWISYYPSVNQKTNKKGDGNTRANYTKDFDSLTQDVFVKFVQFITENKDDTNLVIHPTTGDSIDTSRVVVSSNTFLNNYICNAQLFIQGANNVDIDSNLFQDNAFTFPGLFSAQFTIIPIVQKILNGNTTYSATLTSPLMIRLANYINIEHNDFVNNTQQSDQSTGWTVGTAISIDRHLGVAPVNIYNCTFANHSGAILLLPSITFSQMTIPPLMTYSVWEKLEGVDCMELSSSFLLSSQDFSTNMLNISKCKLENNIFMDRDLRVNLMPTKKGMLWYFKDKDRMNNSNDTIFAASGCQVGSKASAYIVESRFASYFNEVENILLNLVDFDYSYIRQNHFINNTFSRLQVGEEASFIQNVQETTNANVNSYLEISDNFFESNLGRILYVNQSFATHSTTTLFANNTINHHITYLEFIKAVSVINFSIYNISVMNLTANLGFLFCQGSTASVQIQDVEVKEIRTLGKGCLYIQSIDQGFALNDFLCESSELHVIQNITSQGQIVYVSCFAFYGQHSTAIEFDNIACENPSIIYDLTAPLPSDITIASCFSLNNIVDITLQNFSCRGASIQGTIFGQTLSYLAKVNETATLTLTDSNFEDNQAEKSMLVINCVLTLENVAIVNNSAQTDATFLSIQSSNKVYFQNITFQENVCNNCTGGILCYYSHIDIENSNLIKNQALEAPIFNVKMGRLFIENCQFSQNTALTVSSVITSDISVVQIYDSDFIDNTASQNMFTILEGSMQVSYCSFARNKATSGSRNFYTTSAFVWIEESNFVGSGGEKDGINGDFLAIHGGLVFLDSTGFEGGVAQSGGAIYYTDTTTSLSVSGCTFTDNSAYDGGAIYATGKKGSFVSIDTSTFTNNQANNDGGSIYVDTIPAQMVDCTFNTNGSSTIYLSSGSHSLYSLKFNGDRTSSYAQALTANRVTKVIFYFSSISGYGYSDIGDQDLSSSDPWSAVVLTNDGSIQSQFDIMYTTFSNNQGVKGGAIYASGNVGVSIRDCSFDNNIALDGGAIYYDSDNLLANFQVTENTVLDSNQAIKSGGALRYTDLGITIQSDQVTFQNNTAIYGFNIAAYASYVIPRVYDPEFVDDLISSYSGMSTDRRLQEVVDNSLKTLIINDTLYSSGQIMQPPLVFEIRDQYGVRVATDNSSTVDLTISSVTVGLDVTPTIKGNIPFTATRGYIILDSLRVFAMPGSTVSIQAILSSSSESSQSQSVVASITIQLRECVQGETLTDDNICSICKKGQYTFTTGLINSCQVCPEDGHCEGGYYFGPKPNFWRYSAIDHRLNACYNAEACLGATVEDAVERSNSFCPTSMLVNDTFCLSGWCSEGYSGLMCAECREGWAQSSSSLKTCSRCTNSLKYIGIMIGLVILGGVYVFLVIRNILSEEKRETALPTLCIAFSNKSSPEKLELFPSQGSEEKEGNHVTIPRDTEQAPFSGNCDTERRDTNVISLNLSNIPLARQSTKKFSLEPIDPTPANGGHLTPPKSFRSRKSSLFFASSFKHLKDQGQSQTSGNLVINAKKYYKTSIHTKILTNYIQLISIIGVFDFEWPGIVKSLFSVQTAVANTSSELFSFDCILKQPLFVEFKLRTLFTKILVASIAPIIITIFISLIWAVIYLVKYRKSFKKMINQLKSNIIMSIVVTLFILHPAIVTISIQAFQCTTLGDDALASTYLLGDLGLRCYSEEHLRIALPIALPSLVIWGFGIPFFAWLAIFNKKQALDTASTKARFGFLYEGYQTKFFYWEFVIFYRKLVLIMISTFLTDCSDFQALIVLAISAGFYLLQVKILPYNSPTLNEMEKRSLIVSTVTIYCGLFYLTNELTAKEKILPFIVLIFVNLYFLVYWTVEFLKMKSSQLLENKYLDKYCGKVLRKLAMFEWRINNRSTEGEVCQILETAQKKDSCIEKEKEIDEKDKVEQCEQNEQHDVPGDQQEDLPTFMEKLEDPSDITLGTSDYNKKIIKKTGSFHNLFLRSRSPSINLILKDIEPEVQGDLNSVLNNDPQLPKSDLILHDLDSNVNGAMNSALDNLSTTKITVLE